jgi:uncharacterized protein (TIGR02646 family)
MSNKIIEPYKFKDNENALIRSNFTCHSDWDTNVFSGIKINIRDFLRPQQNNKCCYCKRELGYDIKEVDIEHIIPKATYPSFTFNPMNLSLSCPGCNTIKGDKNILTKNVVRYPKKSKYITIVHSQFNKTAFSFFIQSN